MLELRKGAMCFVFSAVVMASISGLKAEGRGLTLVAFEASWCGRCKLFKAEVLDDYSQNELADHVPIEVVDIGEQDQGRFELDERVTSIPTFVLIENDREVSRFSGYNDPQQFYDELSRQVGAAENR